MVKKYDETLEILKEFINMQKEHTELIKQRKLYKKRELERQELSNLLICDFCSRKRDFLIHHNGKKLCGTCRSHERT